MLSPDGALNLVPLAALVDEGQRFLVERYLFTYLTTGRDLIRFQADEIKPVADPLILANPDFDKSGGAASVDNADGRRSADLSNVVFSSLPGTEEEGKAIANLLPKATLLMGSNATEGNLKTTFGPSILHIATHGFFLSEQSSSLPSARGLSIAVGGPRQTYTGMENPLLRSGLGLAGANHQQNINTEDGVLSALEASSLFLQGTKLVVLSACQTGVGKISDGEGIYGLQRALVIAGSESQVISLWAVSDEATKDLMINFYRHLLAKKGRSHSLREAQLEMLGSSSYRHPYFWAPFIQSGKWTTLGQ